MQCCVSPHLDEPHFGFLRILLDKALAILRLLSTTVQTACANLGAIYRSAKSQAHYSKYSRSRSPRVVSDWAQIKSDCAPHKVDLLELKPTYGKCEHLNQRLHVVCLAYPLLKTDCRMLVAFSQWKYGTVVSIIARQLYFSEMYKGFFFIYT